ncbi:MAG: helix-turn-helix transcriptional regulator [Opitutales bacterium]|nr:helix-turn-helix transcriptional regulator [Opitutales bacterium]MBQ2721735.1 helix-turn-helix domain-containing protein [Opitutales bacterium]
MKQSVLQHEKYIWQLFDDNQLRLLPKGNKVSYFSNNSSTRYMPANLINSGTHTITVPETLPTDILAKRGIVSGGFAEHTKGYYHSRKNKKFTDILCVTKGFLSVKYDGNKYKLKVGEALIIPPNRLCDSYVECSKTNVFWLHFKNNEYWNGIFGTEIQIKQFARFEDIHSIMHVYLNEVYGKRRSMLILESLADTLAELIKGEFVQFQRASKIELYERFTDMLSEIERNPDKEWKSKDVAKKLCISVKRLDEYCLSHTSQTFTKFVLKTRMKIAFEMLKSKSLTISEIASRVGYSTPFSFSRIFKAYYGQSPKNLLI